MYSTVSSVDLARYHAAGPQRARSDQPNRFHASEQVTRSLVFVSPPGNIPECVVEALKREFPWLQVEHLPDIEEIGREFESPVVLFLVDGSFLPKLDEKMSRYRHLHRQATAAVIFEDTASAAEHLFLIRDSDFARGVLPMNLRLDVWLSVVGLLLCGGEYTPKSLLRSCQPSHDVFARSPQLGDDSSPIEEVEAGDQEIMEGMRGELTGREFEVMALVARGTQNKVIAAELGLSQNTVKIHLHNIIRKLRVHNRTEAAALFLQASKAGDRPMGGV